MKKFILIIITNLTLGAFCRAQDCPGFGGSEFTNDMEVFLYHQQYPNCVTFPSFFIFTDEVSDLTPLNNIRSLKGIRFIDIQAEEIIGLSGLDSIVQGTINIENTNLVNLDFLSNLSYHRSAIIIRSNPNLVDISGLANIHPDSIKLVRIIDNPQLSVCDYDNICAVLDRDSSMYINLVSGNAGDCFDKEALKNQCKVTEPTDPTLCPIASRPGMQVSKITEERYDVSLHYGSRSMMLRDVSVLRLFDLIHYHKMQRDIMFDFDRFEFKTYCDEAEIVARSVYEPSAPPPEAYLDDKYTKTMSEINFFNNFVLAMQTNESVKM